ncbi:MAG: Radical SAM [uncultured Cytophagales bacterium]|uniref:Radical SAM n=1 Tax=uncultured Cytophagales bacterium TaxID=158755 RepID=A0A6J4H707_9SPHI|nr:MAG: Radical SAM [uncultured Cytophagales bacterium]
MVSTVTWAPAGAFLPASQRTLEGQFRKVLSEEFGIAFNQLFAITNMPVSRYLEFLLRSGNYASYMEKLVTAFNPAAAAGVMCRNTISVGWDGMLYDCDFNQMLELPVQAASRHIAHYNARELKDRDIVVRQHCYGCTAGAGSSCGGATA